MLPCSTYPHNRPGCPYTISTVSSSHKCRIGRHIFSINFGSLLRLQYWRGENGFLAMVASVSEINRGPGDLCPSPDVMLTSPFVFFQKNNGTATRGRTLSCDTDTTRRISSFSVAFYGFPVAPLRPRTFCTGPQLRFRPIGTRSVTVSARSTQGENHGNSRRTFLLPPSKTWSRKTVDAGHRRVRRTSPFRTDTSN